MADAIAKINDEMKATKNNPYVLVVGQFLIKHLEANPQDAEKVLNAEKTIAKSLDEMRKVAEKKKVGNCAVLTDAEGFAVVLKYFGINGEGKAVVAPTTTASTPAPTSSGTDFDVKLDDFL